MLQVLRCARHECFLVRLFFWLFLILLLFSKPPCTVARHHLGIFSHQLLLRPPFTSSRIRKGFIRWDSRCLLHPTSYLAFNHFLPIRLAALHMARVMPPTLQRFWLAAGLLCIHRIFVARRWHRAMPGAQRFLASVQLTTIVYKTTIGMLARMLNTSSHLLHTISCLHHSRCIQMTAVFRWRPRRTHRSFLQQNFPLNIRSAAMARLQISPQIKFLRRRPGNWKWSGSAWRCSSSKCQVLGFYCNSVNLTTSSQAHPPDLFQLQRSARVLRQAHPQLPEL